MFKNIIRNCKSKTPKSKKVLIVSIAILFVFFGGYLFGKEQAKNNFKPLAYNENKEEVSEEEELDFNLYFEVWDNIKEYYVEKIKISDKDLFYGSLKGLAESTGDPYTTFLDPQESKEFDEDLSGKFEGVGMEVGIRNEVITIISPLDDTPAKKAGVMPSDKIYAIDGESTIGMSLDDAVSKIRGPKGTEVKLTIIRGEEKPFDLTITRGVIVVDSVKYELREDGIFVIRISNFNDDTEFLFYEAVNEIIEKNPKGIILDLRNNPGGYLDTAINLASKWIEDGVIVAEQLNDNKREEYTARGLAQLKEYETVVLVNGGSASASEILAGALRDYKKAEIVGTTTYGKGSVQALRELSDGSYLKITVAKWLTPAGDYIDEKGIEPNIEVELTMEDVNNDHDPQMDKAVELILED
ncbi:MAG: S41 family peptidase [Patescibacteria group bacterium]|jgi:carboxyl-terminal processing protease|nr:S41 family peptidase [Patescibacteria group bacterium]